jgi:hypothetical protein
LKKKIANFFDFFSCTYLATLRETFCDIFVTPLLSRMALMIENMFKVDQERVISRGCALMCPMDLLLHIILISRRCPALRAPPFPGAPRPQPGRPPFQRSRSAPGRPRSSRGGGSPSRRPAAGPAPRSQRARRGSGPGSAAAAAGRQWLPWHRPDTGVIRSLKTVAKDCRD